MSKPTTSTARLSGSPTSTASLRRSTPGWLVRRARLCATSLGRAAFRRRNSKNYWAPMTDRPDGEGRSQLERRLGTTDAVVMGLGSMVGAGVFAALAPAAAAAGNGLLIGLAGAAVVAYLNATSTARCAARYPESGGAYVYGRERLGEFWGYLAGWGFVVGKTASCAAIAWHRAGQAKEPTIKAIAAHEAVLPTTKPHPAR